MLAPTPMLSPSPLDVGGLFSGTFQALRQRFGLFILIALLPMVVGMVFFGGGVAIMAATGVIAAISRATTTLPGGLLVGLVLFALGGIATLLAQLKSYAMMTVGAYEVAQGTRPDFRGLLARTRGFLPRMAPVIAIAVLLVGVVYGIFFALVLGAVAAASGRNSGNSSAGVAAVFGILGLFVLIGIPLVLFLQTKLVYTIPATAIEQIGGIDGMKRSWKLTKGAFWRTFGYYLLASLAVGAISYVVSLVGQFAFMPALSQMANLPRTASEAQVAAMLVTLVPAYLLVIGLQLVVQLLTLPFMQTYVAYMFVDQVRRSEMTAAPGYGGTPYGFAPGAPGQYYAPPGQYYGQPGYPPPQYPPAPQQYPPPAPQPPQQGQWPPAPPAGHQPPPS